MADHACEACGGFVLGRGRRLCVGCRSVHAAARGRAPRLVRPVTAAGETVLVSAMRRATAYQVHTAGQRRAYLGAVWREGDGAVRVFALDPANLALLHAVAAVVLARPPAPSVTP